MIGYSMKIFSSRDHQLCKNDKFERQNGNPCLASLLYYLFPDISNSLITRACNERKPNRIIISQVRLISNLYQVKDKRQFYIKLV